MGLCRDSARLALPRFLTCLDDNGAAVARSAYLVGIDGVPTRGAIQISNGELICESARRDPVGLSLYWRSGDGRGCQIETTRLLPRERPYVLPVELARHRLMRISVKREEWGLFGYPGMNRLAEQIDAAQGRFVQALQHLDDPARAAQLGDETLCAASTAADELCRFHASVFLQRRAGANGFARPFLGVAVPPEHVGRIHPDLTAPFDFVRVPVSWRTAQPEERTLSLGPIDATLKAAVKARLEPRIGPLLNFGVQSVPDWLYIYENDYEIIHKYARNYVARVVKRYAGKVRSWLVASGLHTDAVFPFTSEHVLELTRMAATVTRQTDPRAQIVLGITQPWGEYYARNQQTMPPTLYAEMVVQAGIPFDAFGLQFVFGLDSDGFRMRDLLQVSALIDRLANLGKSLQVSAVAVPSSGSDGARQWSEKIQAEWLQDFCRIALSKPYVESVCLAALCDDEAIGLPGAGMIRPDEQPRAAVQALQKLRQQLTTAK